MLVNFMGNRDENVKKLEPKTTFKELEPDGGCTITHSRVQVHSLYYTRSFYTATYHYEEDDGSFVILQTSKGTDEIAAVAANKADLARKRGNMKTRSSTVISTGQSNSAQSVAKFQIPWKEKKRW